MPEGLLFIQNPHIGQICIASDLHHWEISIGHKQIHSIWPVGSRYLLFHLLMVLEDMMNPIPCFSDPGRMHPFDSTRLG